jgi:hypothetical protein
MKAANAVDGFPPRKKPTDPLFGSEITVRSGPIAAVTATGDDSRMGWFTCWNERANRRRGAAGPIANSPSAYNYRHAGDSGRDEIRRSSETISSSRSEPTVAVEPPDPLSLESRSDLTVRFTFSLPVSEEKTTVSVPRWIGIRPVMGSKLIEFASRVCSSDRLIETDHRPDFGVNGGGGHPKRL